jgi:serine O-acetyltransferase
MSDLRWQTGARLWRCMTNVERGKHRLEKILVNSNGHENAQATLGVAEIVEQLRALRLSSLEHRHRRNRPPKLPSRRILGDVVEGLAAALFPNRLGRPGLSEEGIDYFVGQSLDATLRALQEQITLEVNFSDSVTQRDPNFAFNVTRAFAAQLPHIRSLLDEDLQAAYEGDPAARSIDEVLVCYPGITAILHHRFAHVLYRLEVPLVARIIAELSHSTTGIDIHPGAQIGPHFFIDHGTGVVIGETAIVGERVRIYQAVTLGAKRFEKDGSGSLVKGAARHPIVEDDVVIYAGATILGRVTVGRGSSIGGNVWLTHSVPPFSNITQAQAKTELYLDGGGI